MCVDNVARELARTARIARQMPPSWNGGGYHVPVMDFDGHRFGSLMPGRGLYLDCDLKYLGITQTIPHVYEKTRVRKLVDFFKSERGGVAAAGLLLAACAFPRTALALSPLFGVVTSFDQVINARGNGNGFDATWAKASITTTANAWYSLFTVAGLPSGATFTAIPGGAAYDNTTAGASLLNGQVPAPTGGNKAYLQSFGYTSTTAQSALLLVDMLVAAGSISATINTAQTVNTTALTRYTTGANVMLAVEVTTAFGATAQNISMSYTNQAGTSGRTLPSQAATVSALVQRLQPGTYPLLQLLAGDWGVQSVQTFTFSAANTAGACAVELVFPLTYIVGQSATAYAERDSAVNFTSLNELVQTAGNNIGCLAIFLLPGGTASGLTCGLIRTFQG